MQIINDSSELTDVRNLKPHPRNVNSGNVEAISESIHESGFWGGLVVQRSTGYILAGNHRYKAALALGATELPVHWVDINDTAALKILLADNRYAEMGVRDAEALAALLSELNTADTLTGTGYELSDLDALIAGLTVPELPGEFKEYTEDISGSVKMHTCPHCGEQSPL